MLVLPSRPCPRARHHRRPHTLVVGPVTVVRPNGMQHRLQNVHKLGKGLLHERFRTYKQMWPDGGRVFAFFTVPTHTAMWSTERDVARLREQELIGAGAGLLRSHRYHGEWVDAPLRQIIEAMHRVHVPREGRFYVCDAEAIRALSGSREELAEPPAGAALRRAMPLREAKVASVRAFFASLSELEKRSFVARLPPDERRRLWESLSTDEQAAQRSAFAVPPSSATVQQPSPEWLPAMYRVTQLSQ